MSREVMLHGKATQVPLLPACQAFQASRRRLDGLVGGATPAEQWQPEQGFELKRYQSHIEAHIQAFPLRLGELPALAEDARKDLTRRFIAVIFMAHAGLLDVWQEGSTIWVMEHGNYSGTGTPGVPTCGL